MTIYPDDSGRMPNPNYVPPASTKKYVCSKNYKILCKHCMQNIVTIPSGSVVTKEQAEALCEFAKIPLDVDEGLLDKFNSIPN